ncbi:MAG: hypothetical protein ACOC9Y_08415 [Chloroflexota bacterium]
MSAIGEYLGGPAELPDRESLLGKSAPEFQLEDEQGQKVTSRRLTRRGPLMIHLYRGNW